MNQIFRRCIRNAALAVVLCVCAVQVFAQAAGKDWQVLIDQQAAAMKQGHFDVGLDLAQRSLELAETRLGSDDLHAGTRQVSAYCMRSELH